MIEHAIYLIKQGRVDEATEALECCMRKRKMGKFSTPQLVYEKYRWMCELEQEEVIILCLDNQNRVIKEVRLFKGSTSSAYLVPRDIMREAVRVNATGVIILHNHPGGSPTPSEHDKIATRAIVLAGQLLDVRVIDHIIIADENYLSFRDERLL